MSRTKGSKNRAKDVPAADRNITSHDNLHVERDELTDEQLEALTNQHVTLIERLEAADKLAHASLMNAYKIAKADGVLKKDIEAYRNAKTEEGQEKLRIEAERLARVNRWFKLATQASLFGEDETPAPVGNKSYRLGKEAGMNGEKAIVPDSCDIDTFMQGYHAGQAQLASLGIKQAPEDTNTGDEFDA